MSMNPQVNAALGQFLNDLNANGLGRRGSPQPPRVLGPMASGPSLMDYLESLGGSQVAPSAPPPVNAPAPRTSMGMGGGAGNWQNNVGEAVIPAMRNRGYQLMDESDQQFASAAAMNAPRPVRPALRSQDLLTGALPAALMLLLGGKQGAEAAGQYTVGYLEGKGRKASQDSAYEAQNFALQRQSGLQRAQIASQRGERMVQRADAAQARADLARQRAEAEALRRADAAEKRKDAAFAKRIGLMSQLSKAKPWQVPNIINEMNRYAGEAGQAEYILGNEQAEQIAAAIQQGEDEDNAYTIIRNEMNRIPSLATVQERQTAAVIAQGLLAKYPRLQGVFADFMPQLQSLIAKPTVKELGMEESLEGKQIANDTARALAPYKERIAALDVDLKRSGLDLSKLRAQMYGPKMRLDMERIQKGIDEREKRLNQYIRESESRMTLGATREARMAAGNPNKGREALVKERNKAFAELGKLRALEGMLQKRRDGIKTGTYTLPKNVNADNAQTEVMLSLEENRANQRALASQAQRIETQLKALPASGGVPGVPRAPGRVMNFGVTPQNEAEKWELDQANQAIAQGIPEADVRAQVQSRINQLRRGGR